MSKLITAANAPAPELASEDIDCPPLGGSVKVRALWLSQRLAIEGRIARLRTKFPDDPDAAVYAVIPELLAITVVDAKDQPVYSSQRWEIFGANHTAMALELFNTAWRLSGMSGADTKKN